MLKIEIAIEFEKCVQRARDLQQLMEALREASAALGFDYFALAHHINLLAGAPAIRLHNYPDPYVGWFDEQQLAVADPVHRASHATMLGFAWSQIPGMIRLTRSDLEVLEKARREGIGDGFTVPAHVPGEISGSCSFAVLPSREIPVPQLPLAQLIGTVAFAAARDLGQRRCASRVGVTLTDRQRDCVIWQARGKTDWETSRILGISRNTVSRHLKVARERYDVPKRGQLTACALYDGLISFVDIIMR